MEDDEDIAIAGSKHKPHWEYGRCKQVHTRMNHMRNPDIKFTTPERYMRGGQNEGTKHVEKKTHRQGQQNEGGAPQGIDCVRQRRQGKQETRYITVRAPEPTFLHVSAQYPMRANHTRTPSTKTTTTGKNPRRRWGEDERNHDGRNGGQEVPD